MRPVTRLVAKEFRVPKLANDRLGSGIEAVEVELKFEADGPVAVPALLELPQVSALVHLLESPDREKGHPGQATEMVALT